MKRLYHYLNPIDHLGDRNYSYIFPFLFTLSIYILLEVFQFLVLHNLTQLSQIIIFLSTVLVVYFSARQGLRGGLSAIFLTVIYYAYYIDTRFVTGAELYNAILTTVILVAIYIVLTLIIGLLKQTIDTLIDREVNEKRRMQAIIEQLPVGVVIIDKKGKLLQTNRKVEDILGTKISDNTHISKYRIWQLGNDMKKQDPHEFSLATISGGKRIVQKEYVYENNGKKSYLQISSSPIRKRDGKVIASALIINDVSEQKEMEKRKDDFVNLASHELKTPITSLKLYLDSLSSRIDSVADEKVKKTIIRLKFQAERLQELVNELLDVSRLQTGKLILKKEYFRLDQLVQETVEEIQNSSNNHKIKLGSKLRINIYADQYRIYQVFTNLLTNAIKYSSENTEIIVKIKREDRNVIVSVQDFGIGITKDEQRKIFDRLYQISETTGKTSGLGLGLYITQEIIKKHKGKIWLESEKGKGSTFYFSLPVR